MKAEIILCPAGAYFIFNFKLAVWDPKTNFFTLFVYELTHFLLENQQLPGLSHKKQLIRTLSVKVNENCFVQKKNYFNRS